MVQVGKECRKKNHRNQEWSAAGQGHHLPQSELQQTSIAFVSNKNFKWRGKQGSEMHHLGEEKDSYPSSEALQQDKFQNWQVSAY
jgi:hypothetical protein